MFAVGFTAPVVAQNDAVTNAWLFQKDGKLDKAKEEIDKATTNEKTSGKAKTWYFKATIYKEIATSPLPAFQALDKNAVETSYNAYKKVMELDKPDGEYYKNATKEMPELWNLALNGGVKKYEAKDYKGAIRDYDIAAAMKPQDTTAVLYAAYAAEADQDMGKAKSYYIKLIELNRKTPDMYRALANISKSTDKDTAQAIKWLEEGQKAFPNDKNLALEDLSLMFARGKGREAKSKLEEAIKLDPDNAALYSTLGTLYDAEAADKKTPAPERKTAKDKAIAAYTKALELDPKNPDANFNMGVYYYNQGAEISKKVNDMNINDYNKSGKKMELDAKALFQKALPFFERAYEVSPTDKAVKSSLKKLYTNLGRKEDAAKIN